MKLLRIKEIDMENEIINLKEFNKKYIVLAQSEDFATDTIRLKVYDLQEKIYKTLELDKIWFYENMCE